MEGYRALGNDEKIEEIASKLLFAESKSSAESGSPVGLRPLAEPTAPPIEDDLEAQLAAAMAMDTGPADVEKEPSPEKMREKLVDRIKLDFALLESEDAERREGAADDLRQIALELEKEGDLLNAAFIHSLLGDNEAELAVLTKAKERMKDDDTDLAETIQRIEELEKAMAEPMTPTEPAPSMEPASLTEPTFPVEPEPILSSEGDEIGARTEEIAEDAIEARAEEIARRRADNEPGFSWTETDQMLRDKGLEPGTPAAEEFMKNWDKERAKLELTIESGEEKRKVSPERTIKPEEAPPVLDKEFSKDFKVFEKRGKAREEYVDAQIAYEKASK
ncbi:MAG: hypothetical protein AAB730_01605, partial [Patescibacteria group bacterium]